MRPYFATMVSLFVSIKGKIMQDINLIFLMLSVVILLVSIGIMFFVIRKAVMAEQLLSVLKNMSNGIADQLDYLKEINQKIK